MNSRSTLGSARVLLDHTLCSALIGPDGRARTIWRGNMSKPEEVFAALEVYPGK